MDKESFYKTNPRGGISLIVLVITIIVIVILATAIIVSISSNNPIEEANKARFESDRDNMQSILSMTVSKIAAEKQGNVKITAGEILGGEISYSVENAVDKNSASGSIVFSNGTNDGNKYYTGKELPTYKAGETHWYISKDGNISIKVGDKEIGNVPENNPSISIDESFVGYYADFENEKGELIPDGKVDGIIFADLAVGGSGTWNKNSWSSYEYKKEAEGLKSYYVSKDSYTGFNGKWTQPVVTVIEGSGTKDRFYVMALEDFNKGTMYCWYDAACGKLDNAIADRTNDFGQGKTNTTTMVTEWNKGENGKYGAKDTNSTYKDMWGVIQKADKTGKTWDLTKWFVPSKAEWAAFGDMAYKDMKITNTNYKDFGLSDWYWSSSQGYAGSAYFAFFYYGYINFNYVYDHRYVRLASTF